MSKKKLLEFGLKEADAFQKNFKIIFDRLVRGYRSMMGKDPEGLDLLKVKMEAREKALETTKVVNQKGLTLDPDKPIMGGTQEGIPTIKTKFDEDLTVGVDTIKDQMDKIKSTSSKLDEVMKEREAMFKPKPDTDEFNLSKDDPMGDLEKIIKGEGDTGLPKGPRPFGDNIRDAYREAGRSREDATEMIKALDSPGAKQSYEIMEEALGVRLYGDETFEELMQIKETGVHPRGEPPIKKADGGRVGLRYGGDTMGGPNDRSQNTASDTGPGGGATDRGPSFTGDSIGPSAPQDLGFIGSTTTFTPDPSRGPTGTTIVRGPTGDGPGPDYVMSTTPPPTLVERAIATGRNIIDNPITRTLGLGAITAINPVLGGKIRQGMMIKGMLDLAGGSVFDDTINKDVTGQTTALYRDGGLATMFVEKK